MLAFNLAVKFRMSYNKYFLILCRKITKHKSSAIHFQQKEGREGWEKLYSEYFYVQIKLLCIKGLMFVGFSIVINIYYKCHSPSLWNMSRFKSNKCSTQTAVTSYLLTKWTRIASEILRGYNYLYVAYCILLKRLHIRYKSRIKLWTQFAYSSCLWHKMFRWKLLWN